ncbi:unnamed protein product [Rotaria sordida]|uniref:G-protein coupled receptors family 1 profile domain-containing protein n=1 Tax=Rotaria sordida TaxID=392033 RepID=A0A818Q9I3_9BILA|nr:unnamed protein product [Rotaria sordida]
MNETSLSIQERFTKFSILLLFAIPSTICALYFIYNAIRIRIFRKRFQNQTLIILVCIVLLNTLLNNSITMSFLYSCGSKVNYNVNLCGIQCIDEFSNLSKFNWLFNILFPVFIIIFGSSLLLIRVLWVRRIMQRNLRNWSKNWKMIVQLLGIALVYTLVWLPLSIISLMTTFGNPYSSIHSIETNLLFISYLCEMCVPIVALFLTPEIILKLRGRMQSSIVDIASVTMGQYSKH